MTDEPAREHDLRILSWNVENIGPWLASGALAQHLAALGDFDVVCLQEIRLRPRDHAELAALGSLLPEFRCEVALCDDPRNVTFRGGRAYGVATFVRSRVGRVVAAHPDWDREGRVLVTALPALGLAIVNLYAVNGTLKAYTDPATGRPAGDRHAFKQRFQERVLDLADELRATSAVILTGDWNVSPSELDVTPRLRTEEPHATARANLRARFDAGDWVDVFRHREPTARQYTWFGRSRTGRLDAARVDYFIVGRDTLPRVLRTAILDGAGARPHSDHAPLTLDLALPEPARVAV